MASGQRNHSEVKVDKKWLKYAVSREELWARAYSQYIADRSGNPELLGLSPIKQAFIEAIESGEIDGDVVDSGNKSPDRPG